AVGINGLGLGVKGTVTDNTGKTITQFASVHLGMGYFYLEAKAGKSYKANLSFADGSQNTIDLPKPGEQGIVLTVDNDSLQKASVTIAANNTYYQQNKDRAYQLLIYSGGIAITVDCKLDSPVIKLDLAKRHLRTGINTLTLFSAAGEPIAERLFFVQNYDQLNLSVSSDETTYATRGKINIRLNAKNRADSAVTGHFSISVTDESKVPIDENAESTILSNLLLTDDLKGNVEQPNYYFNGITDEKLKQLDLVMLTNGYRRFEWKQVLNNSYPALAYQPEKGLEILGVVKTLRGTPISKGLVSLIDPVGGNSVLRAGTDNKGNFRFSNLVFADSSKFILQAVNAKESNKTELAYIQNKSVPPIQINNPQPIQEDTNKGLKIYMINSAENLEKRYGKGLITGKMLSEVEIKAHKLKPLVHTSRYGVADYVIKKEDILIGGFLSDRLDGRIPGVKFVPTAVMGQYIAYKRVTMSGKPMMIIVDDQEMPARFDINSISTGLIDKIEVVKTVGTSDTEGAILITLLHGTPLKDIPSFGVLPITARGYYKARTFYSPKYDNLEVNMKRKDLRSTIYWNPKLVTDTDGNAEIDYYNADTPGTYRMVVEGIDEKGNLGRKVYRYTVK
ncbi:TonB-dependent receptor, partial [Mucilaginibacter sp.]|uniref:TonB-dependent receptor n=1 Tax=Mucilaginibacter sp. TaxID=1882438 RepID=UPI0026190298